MVDVKEMNKSVTVSYGLIISWTIGLVMGTFVLTTIYNEFLHQQRETARIEREGKEELVRVEGRLDKITKRDREANEQKYEEAIDRITILEEK